MLPNDVAKAGEQPEVTVTHTDTGNDPLVPFVPPRGEEDATQLKERDLERYDVVAEHGRGGLGRVMRARDRDLGRDVAIKEMLSPGGVAQARFVREAMITARLEHPSIVPVHDAGRWPDGTPFYSMKLVSGRPLKEVLHGADSVEARLALVPHVVAVADAIAYAHDRGIIHRDLKPSNIIVGEFGETVVIDWGLAKDLKSPEKTPVLSGPYRAPDGDSVTVVGTVLGTPAYMPPEQARGEEVDERADVYSLGAILYQVVCGSQPYFGGSSAEIVSRVIASSPESLESKAPGVARDLAAIVSTAMARNPLDRYPSARLFADELRRFLAGQLVRSHAYSRTTLLHRWVRRHRAAVTTGLVGLVLLLGFGTASLSSVIKHSHQADRERAEALRQRQAALLAQSVSDARANDVIVTHAAETVKTDPTMALAWLKKLTQATTSGLELEVALAALSRPYASSAYNFDNHLPFAVVFSPDSKKLLIVVRSALALVVDIDSGKTLLRLPVTHPTPWLTASADGHLVSFAESYDSAVVLNLETLAVTRPKACHRFLLFPLISPDGQYIACVTKENGVTVANIGNGTESLWAGSERFPLPSSACWSADSRRLHVVSLRDSTVRALDLPSLEPKTLAIDPSPNRKTGLDACLAAGPKSILTLDASNQFVLINSTNGKSRALTSAKGPHSFAAVAGKVPLLVFRQGNGPITALNLDTGVQEQSPRTCEGEGRIGISPYGRYVAVACKPDRYLLWDRSTQSVWDLLGRNGTGGIAFSADEKIVATIGSDNSVRLWRTPTDGELVATASDAVNHFFSVGDLTIADNRAGTVALIDQLGRFKAFISVSTEMVYSIAAAKKTDEFIASAWDGNVQSFSLENPSAPPRTILSGFGRIWSLDADQATGRLVVAGTDGIRLIDPATSAARSLTDASSGEQYGALFNQRHDRIASVGQDGAVRFWTGSGEEKGLFQSSKVGIPRLARLGDDLITGSLDGEVVLWKDFNGPGVALFRESGPIRAIAVSRSQRFVASSSEDGGIVVYDMALNTMQALLPIHGPVRALAFREVATPSLVLGGVDGFLLEWRWTKGTICALPQLEGINAIRLLSDQRHVLTGGTSGKIRIRDLDAETCIAAKPRNWPDAIDVLTGAIVTAQSTGTPIQ